MAIQASHWTNSDFDHFDASMLGQNTDDNASSEAFAETAHLGFWFNEGGDLSCAYDKSMNCELAIENPYHVDTLQALANWFEMTGNNASDLREMLTEQGYDGISVDWDEEFGGTSYVVFNAEQITILD